jgi:hypothetical protein
MHNSLLVGISSTVGKETGAGASGSNLDWLCFAVSEHDVSEKITALIMPTQTESRRI